MMQNTNKEAAYLGARQWLEWRADTHAEMSPMDGKAYLLAGWKAFYNAHHRKDIQERHGVTEADLRIANASSEKCCVWPGLRPAAALRAQGPMSQHLAAWPMSVAALRAQAVPQHHQAAWYMFHWRSLAPSCSDGGSSAT